MLHGSYKPKSALTPWPRHFCFKARATSRTTFCQVTSQLDSWLGTIAFAGQIFCDFAGYTTCAIGASLCFGFYLVDNFHFPYAAVGLRDFWRRWHMSLSTWLRDTFTLVCIAGVLSDGWASNLKRVKEDVAAIRARGGKVVFVRHPSSGQVRELEDRITPRAAFWDRLLQEPGAPGIYDRDYPALRGFECPEWSHLSAKDSVEYTKRLHALLREQGII